MTQILVVYPRTVTSYRASGAIRHPAPSEDTLALIRGNKHLEMTLKPPGKNIDGGVLVIEGRRCTVRVLATRGAEDELKFGNAKTRIALIAVKRRWLMAPMVKR